MGSEANQPVVSGEVSQEDKNYATIVQGLVLASGLLSIIPILNMLSWVAVVGVIVLFFVWKDRSPFLSGHLRQALGLILISIAIGLVFAIIGGIVAAAAFGAAIRGNAAALGAFGGLGFFAIISLVLNLAVGVLGLMGLLAAQKGEAYEYPVVGKFITNFGQKKA